MANKSLNLKISKAKLIKSLEKSLADHTKRFESNDKVQAENERASTAYDATILKLIKSGKGKVTDVSREHGYWHRDKSTQQFSVTFAFPKGSAPEAPEAKDLYSERVYKSTVEAIENALRMLALSDDEFVSASTVKSISEYL
jgi:hypothetical protein